MSFRTLSFHGYHLQADELFMIAPVTQTLGDEGRQMLLPLYVKQHAQPYHLVLVSQPIAGQPTAEQEEEWRQSWQVREQVADQLVNGWEASVQ